MATRHRLDGSGIESRWGARFPAPAQTIPRTHSAFCTMVSGPSQVNWPGCGVDHTHPSSAEVKGRVSAPSLYLHDLLQTELHLYLVFLRPLIVLASYES